MLPLIRFSNELPPTGGKCAGLPVEIFFPEPGENADEAKSICENCPIIEECREWGIRYETLGIWGGMSPLERKRERQRRRLRGVSPNSSPIAASRPVCGTTRGYYQHRKHGEPICEECRISVNLYHLEHYYKRLGRA